jgi:hypothetical protein
MTQLKDSETTFSEIENAFAKGTLSVPYLYALQVHIKNDKRLPSQIDGADHLEDIAKRCFGHDAKVRLKELNEKGIENIDNPVSSIDLIVKYAKFAGDHWGSEIDIPALENRKIEAHAMLAHRILRDYLDNRLTGKDVPLAFYAFMENVRGAGDFEAAGLATSQSTHQIFGFYQASMNNAPLLADALFSALPVDYKDVRGRTVSTLIGGLASQGERVSLG